MKNKRSFLTILLALSVSTIFAQKGVISGSVLDSTNGEPVSFATIALIKAGESSALTGGISDDKGAFIINEIPAGNYSVMVSFLGFLTKTVEGINVSNRSSEINLGNILLQASSVKIDAVEVSGVAKTSVDKIDRTTYRAADFATARGGSAIDILNKLPSVSVNPDGKVSVRGATDFMVYLNGKPTLMDASSMLSQIPSDNIENIDIITVPTSRYDAQGKGGIINISTKRSQLQGLSLSVNAMAGGTPWSNGVDIYSGQNLNNNRYNTGANLVYNKGRLSLSSSLNFNNKNNKGIGDIGAFIYQDPELGSTSDYPDEYFRLDGLGNRPKWAGGMMATAGASYQISKRSEISAVYQYSKRESGRAAHYLYDSYFSNTSGSKPFLPVTKLYNPNHNNRTGNFSNVGLDYSLQVSGNTMIKSSILYEKSGLDQKITNREFAYDPAYEQADYDELAPNFHSFQTDATPLEAYRFELSLLKEFENGNTLDIGIQPQWITLDGIYSYDTINASGNFSGYDHFNNTIDLKRDVYSGYLDYSGKWNSLSYILGLRMEYLNQEMNVESTAYFREVYDFFGTGRNYDETKFVQKQFDLFPSFHFRYQANDKNIISLAGSRRINRPPSKSMSPFLYRRHQEIFELGDPLLSPEYITNGEMSYRRNLGNNNIVFTGFYRRTDNAIYRVNRLSYDYNANPGGVLLRSYTNSGDQVAIGGELGLNLSLMKSLKLFVGGSLYDFRVTADERLFGEDLNSNSTNWSFKGNLNWNIVKSLKLTVDYAVTSGTVTPQGENYLFSMANLALNYAPKQLRNWNFSAKMLDVLGTNQAGGYTTAWASGIQMFNRDWIYDYEGQIIELSAVYTINMKGKKALKKDIIGGDYF